MQSHRYIILGGGVAAGYAAQTFAEADAGSGEVAIISADNRPPYERPPLSKKVMTKEKKLAEIFINTPDFYAQHGIDLHLDTKIDRVDLQNKRLWAGQQTFEFEKLMIATGSSVKTFDLPGSDWSSLYYLRTADDAQQILDAADHAQRVVVIGGSFIGMEMAASLCQRGLDTTLVISDRHVWRRFFTPQMSAFFERYYTDHGVHLEKAARVESFTGDEHVSGVRLQSGRKIPADLIVAGIGVKPNVDLFTGSDLQINEGIVVNPFLETNLRDIYAAGDVAEYYDSLYDKRRRLEHWDNAYSQGPHAAKVMLGQKQVFEHIPYFFSDEFDLSYEFWGDTTNYDQVIHRGDMNTRSFSVWWLKTRSSTGRLCHESTG